ncbi:MAG: RNA polymerase sigma factor [Phycisphaerae bacterium]
MLPAATRQFDRYTGDVYGWAYRLLGHHHDALDVVQDVFLRWVEQCRSEMPSTPRGWLRRVTLNRALDIVRRRATSPMRMEGSLAASPAPAPAETYEHLDAAALRSDIADALAALTDMQRGVLVAKIYDGMTFAQIAEDLDIAVPTAKTHYLRAIRAVRERLAPRWSEEE